MEVQIVGRERVCGRGYRAASDQEHRHLTRANNAESFVSIDRQPDNPLNHPPSPSTSQIDGSREACGCRSISYALGGCQSDTGTFAPCVDCSLRVRRGEIFGLLGPNGAGKTTLIRLLLGFLQPSEGRCEIDGFDPDDRWRRPAEASRLPAG